MFNFRVIFNILSLLIAINGLAILTAIPFSLYYQEQDVYAIGISGGGLIILGLLGWFFTRKFANKELRKRDGYLVVTLGWLFMAALGAIPYVISGAIPSYGDAFFETMSGYTTTGASILGDQIEALPKGLHFWRAMTHWIGGMGIIVLTIAILPLLGIGGMQLYAAEVPGPTPDKLTPRIKETAKRLWIIYVSLTVAECILLMLGGMNFFDGICHAMSTLSTGGFSTKQASMGAFSAFHQYVVIIFMFIAGTNFSLTYFLFKGKAKRLWANEEFRLYLWFCLAVTVVVTAVTWFRLDIGMEEAFRNASFQVVSIVTTTGFGTADYTAWGPLMMVLFFMLMFNGACAGSTSGGMKMIRFLVLYKNSYYELKRQIHPKAILPVRFNKRAIPQDVVSKMLSFFIIFMLLFVAGTFIMAMLGLDFMTAMGSVAATLGNIGPGIGKVGPGDSMNFAQIPMAGKWILSFFMLLGRLELFTVLMLFTPFFWRES